MLVQSDNVMRRSLGGEVVLTDFGVGRVSSKSVDVSRYEGLAKGHIATRAPELLDGRLKNTFASDMQVAE